MSNEDKKDTLKYVPLDYDREYNPYIEEYYSSPDVKIEINGEEFKEASHIAFSVQEQIKPLYGYTSSKYDDVAIGNRIVVGSIEVPVYNTANNAYIDNVVINMTENDIDLSTTTSPDGVVPGWVKNNDNSNRTYIYSSDGNIYGGLTSDSSSLEYSYDLIRVQQALQYLGYNINTTGIYDEQTRQSIIKYQTENDLRITGNINNELVKKLYGTDKIEYKVSDRNISIYSGPSLNSKVLYILPKDRKYIILETTDNFYYIMIKNNSKVIKGYIEITEK